MSKAASASAASKKRAKAKELPDAIKVDLDEAKAVFMAFVDTESVTSHTGNAPLDVNQDDLRMALSDLPGTHVCHGFHSFFYYFSLTKINFLLHPSFFKFFFFIIF